MKRYIILFAILITAIFYYPVFAYAGESDLLLTTNPAFQASVFFMTGAGLLAVAGLTRRLIYLKKSDHIK